MSILFGLFAFFLTFIFEFIIYLFFIKEKKKEIFCYCFLINLFTWPLANLFFDFIKLFLVVELSVFIVEFILIKYLFNINWKRAVIISLIANLVTALLSFLV